MTQARLAIFLLVVFCSVSRGVIMSIVDSPKDDFSVLGEDKFACSNPELQSFQSEYTEVIEGRIIPLSHLTTVEACFGPGLDARPGDRSRPVFAPMMICESGITPANKPDKRHVKFYQIGDIGYLEVHYGYDGIWMATAAIYFRTDKDFVPLKSDGDFVGRLEWDKAKFAALQQWLDAHLPKITDCGVVEVSEANSKRLVLDSNLVCIIKAQVFHHPSVTNLWFSVSVTKETPDEQEREDSIRFKSIDRPNQSFAFLMDGKYYRFIPKLIEPGENPGK